VSTLTILKIPFPISYLLIPADDCTQDEAMPRDSSSHMHEVPNSLNMWSDRNMMSYNSKRSKLCGSVIEIWWDRDWKNRQFLIPRCLAAEWSNGNTHVDEIKNKFNTHLSLIFGNLEKQSTKGSWSHILWNYNQIRFAIFVRGIATAGRDKIWSLRV
jgi:hypothetical protein